MKFITIRLLLFVCLSLVLSGCGTPPNHCANWWYYWQEGSVVDGMGSVKYLWEDPPRTVGISAPHRSQILVGLSDETLSPLAWTIPRVNKYNPLITVVVYSPRDGGIDGAAEVISHEFRHIWVYQQWGAQINMTGVIAGRQHSDEDAIPDIVEIDRSAGSLGGMYEFSYVDPDTFDMGRITGWGCYRIYGDNEILARVEGISNPKATYPDKDWSKDGKQWRN